PQRRIIVALERLVGVAGLGLRVGLALGLALGLQLGTGAVLVLAGGGIVVGFAVVGATRERHQQDQRSEPARAHHKIVLRPHERAQAPPSVARSPSLGLLSPPKCPARPSAAASPA